MQQLRERYLDLLISVLANTIYEDPPMDPWNAPIYDSALRACGKDWPKQAHTMVGVARLRNLKSLVERTIEEKIEGDYIETGVWRGGCCILMKGVLEAHGTRDRKVFVADSFAGLLPPDPDRFAEDLNDIHHTYRELEASVEEVKANFSKYNLLDENVIFVEGLFEDVLPKLDVPRLAIIRLDGDMYSSTYTALENLYPKLSPGGYVIADDYGALPACQTAVDDYRLRHNIGDPIEEIDWTGVWWRKELPGHTNP